jgi:hypothetical protein
MPATAPLPTPQLEVEVGVPGQQPYTVSAGGDRVAVAATGGVAYAAFYAAIREFLDKEVRLTHGTRTIASSFQDR